LGIASPPLRLAMTDPEVVLPILDLQKPGF
jgi:hypothetical protein